MNHKKLAYSMALIALFMFVDFIAIYDYMIGANSTIAMAVLLGIIVAALMDIPPFFIAGYGYAVLLDDSAEDDQKKNAKIISALGTIYILVILTALVGTRYVQLKESMNNPEFDDLFRSTLTMLIPVLTTIFSVVLGIKAHEKNKVKLRQNFEEDAELYHQIRERRETRERELNGIFEGIGVDTDVENLMESIDSGSNGTNAAMNSINQAALSQVKNRHELHLMQLPNILTESINEAMLRINPDDAALMPQLDGGFKINVDLLRKPEEFFIEMVDKQIEESQARRTRTSPQISEGGVNYA